MPKDILSRRDSRLVIICLLTSLVIAGAIWTGSLKLEERLLRDQESAEAKHWATVLVEHLSQRDTFLSYGKVLPEEQALFDFAAAAGRISRYRVFNQDGHIVVSTHVEDLGRASTADYFEQEVRPGGIVAMVRDAKTPDGEDIVESVAVVPVMNGGQFRGAVEVHSDVTDRASIITGTLRKSRYGLLVIVALLGLALAGVVRRNLQDHAATERPFGKPLESAKA